MTIHLNPPNCCDICKIKITSVFIDGKTKFGPWADMCLNCHTIHGVGLGLGRGQKYELQPDGKYRKVEG